eukprot:365630-Chlamydomonas_euryale.AAC.21
MAKSRREEYTPNSAPTAHAQLRVTLIRCSKASKHQEAEAPADDKHVRATAHCPFRQPPVLILRQRTPVMWTQQASVLCALASGLCSFLPCAPHKQGHCVSW